MAALPTTNQTASTVNTIIHDAIFDVGMSAAKAALIIAWPVCGWPVISQLIDLLFNWVAGYIFTGLADLSTFAIIDVQVAIETAQYDAAVAALQAASVQASLDMSAAAKAKDQAALDAAKQAWKNAFQNLAHFDGAAPH